MKTIDIFAGKYSVDGKRIEQVIEKCLSENGFNKDFEVSVSFVDEEAIMNLHQKYMETYEVTDVLSFPLEEQEFPDGITRLGDIVVCYPVAKKQAHEHERSLEDELNFLVDHGCKHLLGIHHD